MKRRSAYLALAIAAAAVAAVATQWPQKGETDAPAAQTPHATQPLVREPNVLPARLPERAMLRGAAQPLFGVQTQPAPKQAASPPPPQPIVVPQPPVPPYRYVGSITFEDKLRHVMTEGDKVFPVDKGDTIGGVYRVEAVGREKVTLRYVPLDALVELPLTPQGDGRSTALAGAPAIPSQQPGSPQAASASGESSPAFSGIRAAQLRGPRNQN